MSHSGCASSYVNVALTTRHQDILLMHERVSQKYSLAHQNVQSNLQKQQIPATGNGQQHVTPGRLIIHKHTHTHLTALFPGLHR